jgi:carbon monoxide dehydrogenase subunit G
MSVIESDSVDINKSDEEVFNFISDFTNFAKLMPPQAQDVKITNDSCSFTIQGMPAINLKITERNAYTSVLMIADEGKLPFSLKCNLNNTGENKCTAQFQFEAELNGMMKMMVEKPLTNFLNLLGQKLKDIKS